MFFLRSDVSSCHSVCFKFSPEDCTVHKTALIHESVCGTKTFDLDRLVSNLMCQEKRIDAEKNTFVEIFLPVNENLINEIEEKTRKMSKRFVL